MQDIPVATAATAWDNPTSGETIVLIFHQGLWFGDKLTNSLINPNKCRMHGVALCDDPFDVNQELGFSDPVMDIEVPMEFGRSFVYFRSCAPTLEEIRTNPTIEMTSDSPWGPSAICRKRMTREEEEKRVMVARVKIDMHTINTIQPEEPQLPFGEPERDILLASCSAVYCKWTMLQRLIASVQVASYIDDNDDNNLTEEEERQQTVLAVDTRAQHTALSVEEVSRKFGIGLETARKTLKATTQYGIQHAVHPLSRRYQTDIMQSTRKRLNDTFYTDTMFSGMKSLRGNTCAQIFTNGKFVHYEPNVRKSQAGESLNPMINEV
jgi:hypothetical protein